MGRNNSLSKLDRIDQLIGLLKSSQSFTAKTLAIELNISTRTLMRDIQILKERGYPIETEQGRGGGISLMPRWGVGRLALNYLETIDLLLALNLLETLNSPLFLTQLKSVKHKLYASFPDTQKPQIQKLRKRILVGNPASNWVKDTYQATKKSHITSDVLESFFEQKQIDITYQRGDGQTNKRTIEIHYLYLNWPIWYLISFDHLRNNERVFRIDRVKKTKMLDQTFKLKKVDEFFDELEEFSKAL